MYTQDMSDTYSVHLGQYLAESDDIPGLVAQGRTVNETIEIAQDVAKN